MADKPKKPSKLKARLPRGLADRGPAEIAATRHMVERIRLVFERYGFEPVETPAIEYTDALGKFLPDQDRPNEGVFSFQDDDEQWLSLRYDLTAPLARYVAENYQHLALPYRSYRYGFVFRNEKPGPGRFRQFMQFDADTVGAPSMAADAEMCMLAADTMEALGIKRGDYVVKVSSRKILEGLRESIAQEYPITDAQWLIVLRAIDKLDRLDWAGVEALLGEGRKDQSGDYTRGADLHPRAIQRVKDFLFVATSPGIQHYAPIGQSEEYVAGDELLSSLDPNLHFSNINTIVGLGAILEGSRIGENALSELEDIFKLVSKSGFGSRRIRFDASVVRGLEYYTGPVYEVELTFEVKDEKGRPVRFGSVGGGGRYDGLVSRFMGQPVPATGFSIGVSRLQAALAALGQISEKQEPGPVLVTVFDRDRIADYQRMVSRLREANVRAELYLGNPKNIGNQLRYAERRNAPCVIIQGEDEKSKGKVQIKDLIAGASLKDIADHKEYLRQQRKAQKLVSEKRLVSNVQKVLAGHGIEKLDDGKRGATRKPSKTAVKSKKAQKDRPTKKKSAAKKKRKKRKTTPTKRSRRKRSSR